MTWYFWLLVSLSGYFVCAAVTLLIPLVFEFNQILVRRRWSNEVKTVNMARARVTFYAWPIFILYCLSYVLVRLGVLLVRGIGHLPDRIVRLAAPRGLYVQGRDTP